MADSDSDHDDSDVELEIAITYVQLCIEYVQKCYIKRPMCTSILSGKSYVKEVPEGNPQVCYDMFRMDVHIFKQRWGHCVSGGVGWDIVIYRWTQYWLLTNLQPLSTFS